MSITSQSQMSMMDEAVSKSQKAKIQRKQKRSQNLVQTDTGIKISCEPTMFLGVCNAGLSMGLQAEHLLEEAVQHGEVEDVAMIPNKSYCFIKTIDIANAEKIFNGLHGRAKLAQNEGCLYLSYFKDIPPNEYACTDVPDGMILIKGLITEAEEQFLLLVVNDDSRGTVDNSLKHRKVKHYGYEFLYDCNNVDINQPLAHKIPNEMEFLIDRLKEKVPLLRMWNPEQLTVNVYEPGQGIPSHVDTHSAFTDVIVSVSLESDAVMEFKNKTRKVPIVLPGRSVLVMSGETRYDWTHGIVPRKYDIVPKRAGGLTVQKRERRTSLTFRQLRRSECHCNFHELCDTFQKNRKNFIEENIASKLEHENVHKVYDEIAAHFSDTRHKPWPKVQEFVESLPNGSLLLDVGCGNGKYLYPTKDIFKIGCDRSAGLLRVCGDRQLNVFHCDCQALPIRNGVIDGCISIAVIHHLATEARRLQSVKEMFRVLRNGGRGLIYVWAKDQTVNNKKSNYLKSGKLINEEEETTISCLGMAEEVNLPVHTNRTQFKQQDVYVPWKLKPQQDSDEKKVFLRYYHVFEKNELEKLCNEISGLKIVKSYYDQGNWCVIFEKL